MQKIADRIKWDVEKQLDEAFRTFEVIEDMTPKMQDEKNTYCRMRIKTDDNGHVKVKTMRKDPGSDWKVEVEEFDRGNKPIESGSQKKSLGMQGDSFFEDMERMSSKIQKDVEKQLKRAFKTFDVVENRMIIKTDDDGQVRVKAMQNKPTSELKVEVEDQTKGKKSMEKSKGVESGSIQTSSTQPMSMMETGSIMRDMQSMGDRIKKLVEKQVDQVFKTFEVIENRMKIRTDDNNQMQVKASQSGSDAKVEVEDIKKGDMPREGDVSKGSKETVQQKIDA